MSKYRIYHNSAINKWFIEKKYYGVFFIPYWKDLSYLMNYGYYPSFNTPEEAELALRTVDKMKKKWDKEEKDKENYKKKSRKYLTI